MANRPGAVSGAGPSLAVQVSGLRVTLGDQPALRGVDLVAREGGCLALVGPNGAGKSTLLRVLAGLLRPTRGEVLILGRSLAADPWHARRSIGFVGHQAMLHPDLTAQENLAVFARLYGLDDVPRRVEAGLRAVGLAGRADARASTLSRGMLQRLALARALLHEPPILLLDEAEAGLDARAQDQLVAALRDAEAGHTVILASHDLAHVLAVADEVVFLRAGRVAGTLGTSGLDLPAIRERYAAALAAHPPTRQPAALAPTG